MTKRPAKRRNQTRATEAAQARAQNRTRPLDRDGDGQDGGSLPGNQTAPMVDKTLPNAKAEAAQAAMAQQTAGRDNVHIARKLDAAGVRGHDEHDCIPLAEVTQWSDEDARAAEDFADAMLDEGSYTDDQGDERKEDGSPIELPSILAERHVLPRKPKWERDNEFILEVLDILDITGQPERPLTAETIAAWSDEDVRAVEDWTLRAANLERKNWPEAPAMLAAWLTPATETDPLAGADDATRAAIEGQIRPVSDEHRHEPSAAEAAGQTLLPGSTVLRHNDGRTGTFEGVEPDGRLRVQSLKGSGHWNFEPDQCAAVTDDQADSDTFTPEEIAAGKTLVIEAEGEGTTTAADTTTTIDDADPLVTVDTETAPIAVRLRELLVLTSAKRLYHSPLGYSATYAAPFIDDATVDGWVKAGLATLEPTAGNTGGIRCTAEARSVVSRLRLEQAEAA